MMAASDFAWFRALRSRLGAFASAPTAIVLLVATGLAIGYGSARVLHRARLDDRAARLASDRVAPGIDAATEGALVELTNQELKAKAAATVAALRAFYLETRTQEDAANASATDDTDRAERYAGVRRRRSDAFDRALRIDAVHVDQELRRRLGRTAMASIVLPRAFYQSGSGALLDAAAVVPDGTGMSAGFAGVLADAIEQMAERIE